MKPVSLADRHSSLVTPFYVSPLRRSSGSGSPSRLGSLRRKPRPWFRVDQLMAPGPLPDLVQGSASAPVTIVEYASMTCTHCAAFHEETWPTLKAKYVDSGKVKFILREFPLDPLATAGFMLARCAGPDKRNAIVDLLYTQQKNWAFVDKPLDALAGLVKQAGISQSDFEVLPEKSGALRRGQQDPRPRHRTSSRSTRPRLSSSTAAK